MKRCRKCYRSIGFSFNNEEEFELDVSIHHAGRENLAKLARHLVKQLAILNGIANAFWKIFCSLVHQKQKLDVFVRKSQRRHISWPLIPTAQSILFRRYP